MWTRDDHGSSPPQPLPHITFATFRIQRALPQLRLGSQFASLLQIS